ncbi:MAG: hypothetical protein ACRD0A_19155 [Acidimicrobiales bacterium]
MSDIDYPVIDLDSNYGVSISETELPVPSSRAVIFTARANNISQIDSGPFKILWALDGTPYHEEPADGIPGGGSLPAEWKFDPMTHGFLDAGEHWVTVVFDYESATVPAVVDDGQLEYLREQRCGQLTFTVAADHVDMEPDVISGDPENYARNAGYQEVDFSISVVGPYSAPVRGCTFWVGSAGHGEPDNQTETLTYSGVTNEGGILELPSGCWIWPKGWLWVRGYLHDGTEVTCEPLNYGEVTSDAVLRATIDTRPVNIGEKEVEGWSQRLSGQVGGEIEFWKLKITSSGTYERTAAGEKERTLTYTVDAPTNVLKLAAVSGISL